MSETGWPETALGRPWILPNLGAEEGLDWRAYPKEPAARVAAGLLALLFPGDARLVHRRAANDWPEVAVADLWPASLGPVPESPVWPWLDTRPDAFAWLATPSLVASLAEGLAGRRRVALAGPAPETIATLHDKAFAVAASRALGLHPGDLDPLIEILEPADLTRPDTLVARLEATLARWPAWTRRRFTLKPRFGSSGRGRIGGEGVVDTPALRGGLARLARRGGAVLEPWLERTLDLSAVFRLAASDAAPVVLASFELITSASGVFRGHCGELDADGRIHSGSADDDRLRSGAKAVAEHAARRGFFGVGGLDAFRYRTEAGADDAWRGLVELNARPTMGLVTAGLIRRALPRLASPGAERADVPRAFLFTQLAPDSAPPDGSEPRVAPDERIAALLEAAGPGTRAFELARRPRPDEPRPLLVFGPDRGRLRAAHRAVVGC